VTSYVPRREALALGRACINATTITQLAVSGPQDWCRRGGFRGVSYRTTSRGGASRAVRLRPSAQVGRMFSNGLPFVRISVPW
jgi:hypothetical protein